MFQSSRRRQPPPSDDDRPFPHLSSFTRQDRMKKAAYYLLESQNASQEQWQFFETWLKFVFDEAVHVAPGGGPSGAGSVVDEALREDDPLVFLCSEKRAQLRVPSDLESFELSIKASKELMLILGLLRRLANRFLQACKVPDLRMMSQLSQLQHEIPVSEISLWCRIKRMGKPEQAVDAGFHLDHPVEWLLADLVLPKCEDHASLRNNAMSNRLVPQSYGASLFPVEPESSLSFAMETRSALFIFKAMGFAKPSDPSLTAITHVEAASCDLLACLGPRGLTRMGLRFNQPTPNGCAAGQGDHVETVEYELDDHAHFLEYAAEKRGYTVTLGFVLLRMAAVVGRVRGFETLRVHQVKELCVPKDGIAHHFDSLHAVLLQSLQFDIL
ncbi:Beta-carotene isomerase D27 [Durusdinium trenchii]|uniref:Chloroplastic n=1 Tax=Durusdinium trenchii TaxID=1381693 RepID=A0ABP0SMV4_9DINO